jgi:signal transduction histidine kinase
MDVVTRGMDEPATVTGDAAALEQIFLNLLLNALEASDEGGRVEVSLSSTDVDVVIAVADRGVGIAPEDIPRVYDPLYTTRRDGSGLGLTIAHRLVTAHSGRIEIESESGTGTIVRVILPAENVAVAGSAHRNAT